MESWNTKVSFRDLVLFCKGGKTRAQIAKEFDLTRSESWSAVKYISSFSDEIKVDKKKGQTKKAFIFTCVSTIVKKK